MNEFDLVFVSISCNVLFLALWFKSNAVYEYLKVFRFDKVKFLDEAFGLSEYDDFLIKFKSNISYAEYTQVINDNFFGRFVSCPLCLSFWIQWPVILLSTKCFPICVISSVMIYNLYFILQKHGTN